MTKVPLVLGVNLLVARTMGASDLNKKRGSLHFLAHHLSCFSPQPSGTTLSFFLRDLTTTRNLKAKSVHRAHLGGHRFGLVTATLGESPPWPSFARSLRSVGLRGLAHARWASQRWRGGGSILVWATFLSCCFVLLLSCLSLVFLLARSVLHQCYLEK